MAKSIKLQVVSVPGFNKAIVKVVAQTNRGVAFGNIEGDKAWEASNGIKLVSNKFPARDTDKSLPACKTFYVRGSDTSKDDNSFVVSLKKLPKLIAAVKEYNAYYTPSAINARVRAKRAAEEQARLERARAEQARLAHAEAQRQAAIRAEQARVAELARRAAFYAAPARQDGCSFIVE